MRSPLRRRAFWLPITLSMATAAGLIAWTLHRASVDEDTLSVGANREPESFADGHARAIVHLGKRIGRIDTRVAPSPEGGVRLEERTALSVRRRGRTAITSRTLVAHTDAQGALVSARMESGAA